MFTITCESFIVIRWTVCAPVRKVQHRVLRLVQCLIFLNFHNHNGHVTTTRESDIAIGWTVCVPIRHTHTHTHTHKHTQTVIFIYIKFRKSPRACLQQLLKVSSQSDERCVLLYGTNIETFIFIYRLVVPSMHCNATQRKCLCLNFDYRSAFGYTIFLFFHLLHTQIHQVFRRVSRPHTAVHVQSMDFPNLVHTLVAISRDGKGGWSCRQWHSSCFEGEMWKISTFVQNFIKIRM